MPRLQGQVFEHCAGEFFGNRVGAGQGHAAAAWLAVYAHADFHLVHADLEGRFTCSGHGAGGQRHAHGCSGFVDRVAQRFQCSQCFAALGGSAQNFLHDQGAGHAAPPRGVSRVFHRHIVIDHHHGVFLVQHFGCHLEIHHVAGVVLDDEENASATVHGLRGIHHLVGCGRGEDLTRAGRVKHAVADKTGVQRLVPGTAAGDQCDLTRLVALAAHKLVLRAERDDVGMRGGKAVQRFGEHVVDVVHQVFHGAPLRQKSGGIKVFSGRLQAVAYRADD